MLVKYWPSGGKVSGVGRHACRFMSTECWSIYRPPYRAIVSTDTRSTDVLSTHDPDRDCSIIGKSKAIMANVVN